MCCSGSALTSPRDLALRRRWQALQADTVAAAPEAVHVAGEDGGAGGETTVKQYCLCSPTQHPGSFRCRQHHGEYAWGGGRVIRRANHHPRLSN